MAGQGFVAIDMGASSARYAAGRIVDDRLVVEVVEQVPHGPVDFESQISNFTSGAATSGPRPTTHSSPTTRLLWDTDLLFNVCDRAAKYAAASFEEATIGVDTWGVDIAFLPLSPPGERGSGGEGSGLVQAPVAYRDESHVWAMESIVAHQERLYALTGVQKQPFNTLNQLIARRLEDPSLPSSALWLLLPDLFVHHLAGSPDRPAEWGHELTHASTTQLLGLDGSWCEECFEIAGWPLPKIVPETPGRMIGKAAENVDIVRVGGHDTASAVCGLGSLEDDIAFMSVGTWSLLGCLLDSPLVSDQAREDNFTNERAVDGRVRFLKNMPGFFVMNGLTEELGADGPMSEWLARADQSVPDRLDLFDAALFNPASMTSAVIEQLGREPQTNEEWAGIALMSLADATATQLQLLEQVTGRTFASIRAGGGGSASGAFCQAVADACGLPVVAGPVEATVLGNIGMQLLAKGVVRDHAELGELLRRSSETEVFHPRE